MSVAQFSADLRRAVGALGEITGEQPKGHRAPCFSLDRERLDIVREAGFAYDSSRISLRRLPGRGTFDLPDFKQIGPCISMSSDFCAFEVGTLRVLGRNLPVSSGGYLRQLPWWLMSRLVRRYLQSGAPYVVYVHPFELSDRPDPHFPADAAARARFRFSLGRKKLLRRLGQLVELLKQHGYAFTTFRSLREQLIARTPVALRAQ